MSLVGNNMDIKFHMLEAITNKFADDRKLYSGTYGQVYKGVYNDQEILVKELDCLDGVDVSVFQNELSDLWKVDHPNIVRLIGYCHESQRKFITHKGHSVITNRKFRRFLCYEYVEGQSLLKHISAESCDLDWPTCYKIVKGICEGLNYLHNAQGKPIYHLDLKPDNILLDKNKTAKIADLGFSRLVSTTEARRNEMSIGTPGFIAPEVIEVGIISKTADVYSLGVIIIQILDGYRGNIRRLEMPSEQFAEHVTGNWKRKLQGTSGHLSQENHIRQVEICIIMALRCVDADPNRRPHIKDIVSELEELEALIKKMPLFSDHQYKDLISLQKSSDSNVLAVDPTLELRFVFEPRKDLSCCLQLTNKTDGPIAFNIKTNQTKYYTEPIKGIMPTCSKRYICVTLQAQDEAPPNMQCHDMLLIQSINVNQGMTPDEITEDFFKKVMVEKVVDVVTLPIVYIARGQLPC